jgi:hypothetical protein
VSTVSYVGAFAVWTGKGREGSAWTLAVAAACIALVSSRTLDVRSAAGWGLAVVLASLGTSSTNATLGAFAAIGVLSATAAACIAMTRVPADPGVAPARSVSPRLPLVILALACCSTLGPSLYPAAWLSAWVLRHPATRDFVALTVSAGTLLGLTERTHRTRRLELDVVERALAARSLEIVTLMFALVLALFIPSHARSLARLGVTLAAACAVAACVTKDAVQAVRASRRAIALSVTGGGVVLLAGLAAQGASSGWVAGLTAALALAIGSGAAFVEKPLRPAGGTWLDAFARAGRDAARAEPDDAIRSVLAALRSANGPGEPSPELWTLTPPRQTTVDAAGYLREQAAELPGDLLAVATAEPEAALRSDVLDALEIRRPDLRLLCGWMAARGALLAARIAWEGEPEGILILPRGQRRDRVTLEELHALRGVASCLAVACRARAASARMRAEVKEATESARVAEARAEEGAGEHGVVAARIAHEEERVARPAELGIYSAVARMAVETLERRVAAGGPVVLLAPSGLDPVPFVARAHLATSRSRMPLVVVDGTGSRERKLTYWQDIARSPLQLADGGLLVLVDASALPTDVQHMIGVALTERRGLSDMGRPLTVQLIATLQGPSERPALEPRLARAFGEAFADPVVLPPLSERADDFRALLLDGLAREGLRSVGRPFGIEPSAYARLADYEFPGDVAELWVIVQRLAVACRGDTIRQADVDALELFRPGGRPGASGGRVRKDPISA